MYFNLDELPIIIDKENKKNLTFTYEGKKYFFKETKSVSNYYNEIIAKKIADRLNIPCCNYYLSSYQNNIGNTSEYFDTTNFKTMYDFLKDVYQDEVDNKNNIESIKHAFYLKFPKETADKLCNQLENIFLFDCLIGNCDRNDENYGLIIREGSVEFAPLYDNENMLSDYSIYDGEYSLSIDEKNTEGNMLYTYLDKNKDARTKLLKMLEVISEESLEEIFFELESEYEINPNIKKIILEKFRINRNMIRSYFEKSKIKEMKIWNS